MTASVEQEIAGLNKQNSAALGKLLGRGSVGQAEEKTDGRCAAGSASPSTS